MKIATIAVRILLGLVLLLPVLGTTGIFPEPTADMYSNTESWLFISALMTSGYMMPLIGLTCFVCLVLNILGRTALMAVLLAPFSLNVILFHVFMDATPVSAAAIPAYVLLGCNLFFLWVNRTKYKAIW